MLFILPGFVLRPNHRLYRALLGYLAHGAIARRAVERQVNYGPARPVGNRIATAVATLRRVDTFDTAAVMLVHG